MTKGETMRKIILILFAVMLWAGNAFGATYYCDCDAVSNGDGSEGSPFNTIAASQAAAGNSDVVNIKGACTLAATFTDAGATGQTWQAWDSSAKPTISWTTPGATFLAPTANSTYKNLILNADYDNVTQDLIYGNNTSGWSVSGCELYGGRRSIVTAGSTNSTIEKNLVYCGRGLSMGCHIAGSGIIYFDDNIVIGGGYHSTAQTSTLRVDLGTAYIRNNDFFNTRGYAIQYERDAVTRIDIQNNMFVGGGDSANVTAAIYGKDAAGAIVENISNNYYSNGLFDPTVSGIIGPTCTNCLNSTYLGLVNYPNQGKFIFSVDDYSSTSESYYTDISNKLIANGKTGVFFLELEATENWTYLNALFAAGGLKCGYHSMNHLPLIVAQTAYAFAFSTYPVGATIEFDGTTLIITSDGTAVVFNQDITATAYDTFPELITAINGLAGFSDTATHVKIGSKLVRSDSMKSYIKTAIGDLTSGRVELDYGELNSRFYTNEITRCITEIKANIGNVSYLANAFDYPGGYVDSTLVKWLQNNEDDDVKLAFGTSSNGNTSNPSVGINIYKIVRVANEDVHNADQAVVAQNSRAIAAQLATSGGIAGIYAHTAAEFPAASLQILIDALAEYDVPIVDVDTAYNYLTDTFTGSDVDSDGNAVAEILYLSNPRTLFSGDFHLLAGSSCIGTGTAGATTDYDGVLFGTPSSIGALEFVRDIVTYFGIVPFFTGEFGLNRFGVNAFSN
jgi:hypothetical protein